MNSDEIIKAQQVEIQYLKERIAELERQLGLNSNNSSKPPSSDGLKKETRRTTTLRESNKAKGGQKGHIGKTMERKEPTHIKRCTVDECAECKRNLKEQNPIKIETRQTQDIQIIQIITDYELEVKRCICGATTKAQAPKNVNAPVQLGPTIKSTIAYLAEQFIPINRLSEVMNDLFQTKVSPTTVMKTTQGLAQELSVFYAESKQYLIEALIKHLDETGIRVDGSTNWMHVLSDALVTYLHHNKKRKSLIPELKGTVVHDHYAPYLQLKNAQHVFCNAHILRELKALKEIDKEAWAASMYDLEIEMCKAIKEHNLAACEIEAFERRYDVIIQEGFKYHEALPPLDDPNIKKRGKVKRRIGHNLLIRLRQYKTETLRFLHDSNVPFTNNQAERDVRMVKGKQKVSGSFRSKKGVEDFAIIRSFISTVRKNNVSVLQAICTAFDRTIHLSDILII